jgi:death-on-curing family protein
MKISPGDLILPGPKEIEIVHECTILRDGGLKVKPNLDKIESALLGVITHHSYAPDADIALLASVLAYNFAKVHPLPDGNKRVAFLAVKMIMRLNGFAWKPRHDEAEQQVYGLAAGDSVRSQALESFAEWIRKSTSPLVE